MPKKKKKKFRGFRPSQKPPYKTIKVPLKSVLGKKKEIQACINELVCEINDLTIHSYQFIRLYILECYNKNGSIPTIDEKFVLYCIRTLGKKDNRGRKCKDAELLEKLKLFYKATYQPLLKHKPTNLKNRSKIIQYLATQIHTSLSNNLQERFIQHFLRFVNKTVDSVDCDKSTLFQFKMRLLRLESTGFMFDRWKKRHLPHIFPESVKKNVHYDVKARPFEYLKGMLYMVRVLEKAGHKLFQALPLRTNIVPKHITLDTAGIVDYFGMEGKTKTELLKAIREHQHEVWDNILNLNHKVFRNKHYRFHHQIQTDGISCCLLFIRKGLESKKRSTRLPSTQKEEYHNLQGLPIEILETRSEEHTSAIPESIVWCI